MKAGVYREEVHTIDLAPTLAAILEIGEPASSEGTVLTQALVH